MANPALIALGVELLTNVVKSATKPKLSKDGKKSNVGAGVAVTATAGAVTVANQAGVDVEYQLIMTIVGTLVTYLLAVYRDHKKG